METITVLRATDAMTETALMAEIAKADSRDGGTGDRFGGLCVGLLAGQSYRPARPSVSGWVVRWDDDVEYTPETLQSYFATQGHPRPAVWSMDVAEADVIGYAYRIQGTTPRVVLMDGIVLRQGAPVSNVKRVY